jgi:RimJ/RimL family protein N-acetyltransferase
VATAPEPLRDGDTVLRRFTLDDAAAIARAVGESLAHLDPWMPWAKEEMASPEKQRERLHATVAGYDDPMGSWDYALCEGAPDGPLIGSVGLVKRDDGRLELGYWAHVDAVGRGHATRGGHLLVDVWRTHRSEPRLELHCDEANTKSANVARKLGFELEKVIDHAIEAKQETGRMMIWVLTRAPAPNAGM